MASITEFMTRDHRACDEAFARAEESAARGDWPAAETAYGAFQRAMTRHLAMEEEVLFPAFEETTGMAGAGPTEVMRLEHEQMRALFAGMRQAVAAHDEGQFLGLCETLVILMQQHNLKEEDMLYRMMDEVLAAQATELIGNCNALETAAA